MKKDILAAAFLVLMALVIGIAGCRRTPTEPQAPTGALSATLQSIGSAPASLAVSDPVRPYFYTGLCFLVIGGLTLALGGRGTGFALMGVGVAIAGTGTVLVQYPWLSLVAALVVGVIALFIAYDRYRLKRKAEDQQTTLEVLVPCVERHSEIKPEITSLGPETESKVRQVIRPIKRKLRELGKME